MVKKIIKSILFKFGFVTKKQSHSSEKNELLYNFFKTLLDIDFKASHIIDIGANHGAWTRETMKYYPKAKYTLLEPQENLKHNFNDLLKKPGVNYFACGAGAESGEFRFTIVDRDDSCSFRYSEEEAKAKGFKQVVVPVVTINELIERNNLPIPDLIKIDAEGNDLDVLEGCSNLFGKTEVFMVEAAVVSKLFKNNVYEVVNYMNSKGYNLFDITDMNRPWDMKVLWLLELVFIKKGGIIDINSNLAKLNVSL